LYYIRTHFIWPSQEPYFLYFIATNSNTSLHKIMSLWIPSYRISKFFCGIINKSKIENTKIDEKYIHNCFLLPSRCFKKVQHPTSMIQNIVFFNSRRQLAKTCPIQINTSTKLQRYLEHKLYSTHMTPGPPLYLVQVQICFQRHMKSTWIH
jgi:hypothetical protein